LPITRALLVQQDLLDQLVLLDRQDLQVLLVRQVQLAHRASKAQQD
jgi:hypothetical protein